MRFTTFGLGFGVLALCFANTASAAGGGTSGSQVGKGSSEGRGGAGPGSGSGGGPGGSSGTASGGGPGSSSADKVYGDEVPEKAWEVGGLWETHRLIRQSDLNGSAPNKTFNVFGLYGQYDITEFDRIKVRTYLYERFLADQGETGFRFDDIILQYTRRVPLPEEFTLRATAWMTVPTSFDSQKASLITAPRLIVDMEKQFGHYVKASARTYGDAYIVKYRTYEGGRPNPKYDFRLAADVEVSMPFHMPLSFGAAAATGYIWYYEPNNPTTDPTVQATGAVGDSTFQTQPIRQTYSGEIYARYVLPPVIGVRSDILLALANGDPSLGSTSVLHDGVGHFYLAYRQTAEVYASLTVRY